MSSTRPREEFDWRAAHDRVWATLDWLAEQNREHERLLKLRAREAEQRAREAEQRAREQDRRNEEADRRAKEADRRAKERAKEQDRRAEEADRRAEEADRRAEEADRRGKEHDRRLRKLDNLFNSQWGKLIEALVDGDLVPLLRARDIKVTHTSTNMKLEFEGYRREVDIVAVDGSVVVAVEVKTTLKVADVDYFLEMLPHFQDLAPEYRHHTVYGAVAYLKADQSSDAYAQKKGLFVIRATGSSASITNRAEFRPRAFG